MKTYRSSTGIRIVGKAYEVRWQLQSLAKEAGVSGDSCTRHVSLADHLADSLSNKRPSRRRR